MATQPKIRRLNDDEIESLTEELIARGGDELPDRSRNTNTIQGAIRLAQNDFDPGSGREYRAIFECEFGKMFTNEMYAYLHSALTDWAGNWKGVYEEKA